LVRTASYADYFDTVAALWEVAAGPYEDLLGAGFAIAPAELHVHYLGLAELDDELKLEARIVRLGPSSIMTDRRDGGRAACRERLVRHELVADQRRGPGPTCRSTFAPPCARTCTSDGARSSASRGRVSLERSDDFARASTARGVPSLIVAE
jgi:hypothetical protein